MRTNGTTPSESNSAESRLGGRVEDWVGTDPEDIQGLEDPWQDWWRETNGGGDGGLNFYLGEQSRLFKNNLFPV